MTAPATIETLLEIMARLRDPQHGCPWDQQQDFRTIAPFTLEEAYEVVDAINRDDMDDLQDELGDLLFQVVYHAQMANEAGQFDFSNVLHSICDKMVRRHPHVFADEKIADAEAQTRAWERHKESERKAGAGSALDGVPMALPALTRACKLQRKASRVGFDWPDSRGVAEKVEEELQELRAELGETADPAALAEEAGDLLFAVVNLVRHAGIDPETALHQANRKFTKRFQRVEARCRESGYSVSEADLETLDGYWEQVKREE
ncbi:MAG: nucleoside triphosphate pyrophosphohydrolase [Halobacteria archaeon]|nr:nucleoside triphosphate pyrophosphohydrolase [Halobacteria archaeon]